MCKRICALVKIEIGRKNEEGMQENMAISAMHKQEKLKN